MLSDKLRRILNWFNARRKTGLDRTLVKQLQGRRLPNWRQFTYLPKFLNKFEKRLMFVASSLICVVALAWLGIFIISHIGIGPKAGGDYSEGLVGEPKYINPLFASASDVDADISSLIYNGLFAYDATGQLVSALAKNYTVSTDGKVYDIDLRDNVLWSDKEKLTANDVLFTFETIQNPEVASPLLPTFQGVKIEKTNAYSVRFTLKEPFSPFLSALTTGILPEHIWSDIQPSSLRLAKNNLQPIGTGPYLFQKLTKDSLGNIQSYTLANNDNWFGPKPYLKTITFKFYSDYPQAIEALRGQTIHGLAFVPREQKDKLASRNLAAYALKLPEYTALFFNQSKQSELKNDSLRMALALALDKKTIVSEALAGAGEPIDAPLLTPNSTNVPGIKHLGLDLLQANALLDKTWARVQPEEYFTLRQSALLKTYGLTDQNKSASSSTDIAAQNKQKQEINDLVRKEMAGQTFYRKDKDGNLLALVITTADTAPYPQTAELVAEAWKKIGVQTQIKTIGARQIGREIIKPRDYEILLYSELVGGDPDPYAFWHSSQTAYPGLNLSLYNNRNADQLIEAARATADPAKREGLYQKFEAELTSDLPAIFLYAPFYSFLVSKDIQGINLGRLNNPSDRFHDLNNWYIKTTWAWKR